MTPKFRFIDEKATRANLRSQHVTALIAQWAGALTAADPDEEAIEAVTKRLRAAPAAEVVPVLQNMLAGWEGEWVSHDEAAKAKSEGLRADDGIDNDAAKSLLERAHAAALAELDRLDPPKKAKVAKK